MREHAIRGPPYGRLPFAAPVGLRGREPPVLPQQLTGPRRIGEQPVDVSQRVIAGGPRDRPGRGERLPVRQDLLDDGPPPPGGLVQPPQIGVGIGESVRMIDPQPLNDVLLQQLEDLRMGRVEDLRFLHPHPDQLRDTEEPPVVQLRTGQPPPHRPVPLRVQQLRQRQLLGALPQREHMVVVAQLPPVHHELLDLRADRPPEHRQQHPPVPRLPVDVEPPRVRRLRPVPQHRPQRPVVPRRHRHVVRHDVHDHPEPMLPSGPGQRPQPVLPAELPRTRP